jgi:RNA polymerase sigma factor (sigma-70 family)
MTTQERKQLERALTLVTQGGDPAERGYRIIFDVFWPRFVARFSQHGLPSGSAQDLASDAVLKIVLRLSSLRDPATLERWANVVARNTLLDYLRAHRDERARTVDLDDDSRLAIIEQLVDQSLGDLDTQRCLERQLAQFCEDEPLRGNLLTSVALDGWSIDEIAQTIGRTPGAAKEYLSQCRKMLWRYMSECLDGT